MQKKEAKGKKYFVIHGHFYQPPRENPWTGTIDLQESAAPRHDWNERIARECYIPNGMARINDHEGNIVDIVNNYEYFNFDFGPTLLSWYEAAFPREYKMLIEAFDKSRAKHGHGNAIAHVYNHIIMPLANFRDQSTQILWGIADFRKRFKVYPQAMWLAETACNKDVMRLLVDQGLRYVILAPSQAAKARHIGDEKWTDVSDEQIDITRPYLWQDRDEKGKTIPGRSISVFFYHGPFSKAIAFENAMNNSFSAAERIDNCFAKDSVRDQLVSIATDGESYGHHQKFADLTLAHLFRHELARKDIEITNYSAFLETHPPSWEVEIKAGADNKGTSWSCAHGVSRWTDDCGCGREGSQHLLWRLPLRNALDWLRDNLANLFEKEGSKIFINPWHARNEYINVILDRSETNIRRFMQAHAHKHAQHEVEKAMNLLEMQKNALFMYTSCGWFFSDISRIETVQNLKYAAKAVETAAEFGMKLEPTFLQLLAKAPSNFAELPTGKEIYLKLAKTAAVTPEKIAAETALYKLADKNAAPNQTAYSVSLSETKELKLGKHSVLYGIASLTDRTTLRQHTYVFFAHCDASARPECFVGSENPHTFLSSLLAPETGYAAAIRQLKQAYANRKMRRFRLSDMSRESIINITYLLHDKLSSIQHEKAVFGTEISLLSNWVQMVGELPQAAKDAGQVASRKYIAEQLREYIEGGKKEAAAELLRQSQRIKNCRFDLNTPNLQELIRTAISITLDRLEAAHSPEETTELGILVAIAKKLEITHWEFETQNRIIRLFEKMDIRAFLHHIPLHEQAKTNDILSELLAALKIKIPGITAKLSTTAKLKV